MAEKPVNPTPDPILNDPTKGLPDPHAPLRKRRDSNLTPKQLAKRKERRAEILERTIRLLSKFPYKGHVKAALKKLYPEIGTTAAGRYISRARQVMAHRYGKKGQARHRQDSYYFYVEMLMDPEASPRDKIYARERIDSLFGLDAPKGLELSGKDGKAIQVKDLSDEALVKLIMSLEAKRLADEERARAHDGPKRIEVEIDTGGQAG